VVSKTTEACSSRAAPDMENKYFIKVSYTVFLKSKANKSRKVCSKETSINGGISDIRNIKGEMSNDTLRKLRDFYERTLLEKYSEADAYRVFVNIDVISKL
jgi:hypothetical protein